MGGWQGFSLKLLGSSLKHRRRYERVKLRHSRKKEGNRFIRRAKQFALASGFGLATLIASPEHIMAQQQPEAPVEAPAEPRAEAPAEPAEAAAESGTAEPRAQVPAAPTESTAESQESRAYGADELVGYLGIITGPATRATHPTRAPTAQSATNNSVKIWQILQVVQGSRPAESDPMRRVYDQAIAQLGEGEGRAGALQYLQRSLLGSLQRLQELTPQEPSELGERAPDLRAMLQRVSRGASADEEGYDVFASHLNLLTSLLGVTEGVAAEAQSGPREVDDVARAVPLPIIQIPQFNLGAIRLVSSRDMNSVVSLNGQAGPTTVALFGNEANAQTFVNAYGNAYATLANNPNDAAALRQAAQNLFNALSQIPPEREIWSRPAFQEAMRKLQAGNLEGGLRDLGSETSLNSILQSLNNFYVVSVNQRAVSILNFGVTARYEFPQNMPAFQEYLRGTRFGSFDPQILWMSLDLDYDYLLMSGQLQQLRIADTNTGEMEVVGRQRLRGAGHQFSIRPEFSIGAGIGGDDWALPMEIVIGSTIIPYQQWSLTANVQMQDGGTRRLEVGDEGAMLGLTSAEFRFPGQEGQRWMMRFSRFGLGVVPTLQDEGGETGVLMNPLVYFTMEGNWFEGNRVRLQSLLTPQYSYFLEQHRLGGDLRPLNIAVYAGEEGQHQFFVGPGFRYDYNFANDVSTLEGRLGLGYRYRRSFEVNLQGGVIGEVGGSEYDRMWTTPFGGVNFQFNIGEFIAPSQPERSSEPARSQEPAAPVRVEEPAAPARAEEPAAPTRSDESASPEGAEEPAAPAEPATPEGAVEE